jgi:hypothetical protein
LMLASILAALLNSQLKTKRDFFLFLILLLICEYSLYSVHWYYWATLTFRLIWNPEFC